MASGLLETGAATVLGCSAAAGTAEASAVADVAGVVVAAMVESGERQQTSRPGWLFPFLEPGRLRRSATTGEGGCIALLQALVDD